MLNAPRKPPKTAFKPGHPGGGPGRPPGVRNKLTETVTAVLSEDFELHGREAIERVREKYPQVYLSAVVSLLPKQQQVEKLSQLGHLSDEELALVEEMLAASRAKLVRELERHNGAVNSTDRLENKQSIVRQSSCRNPDNAGFVASAAIGTKHRKPLSCSPACCDRVLLPEWRTVTLSARCPRQPCMH